MSERLETRYEHEAAVDARINAAMAAEAKAAQRLDRVERALAAAERYRQPMANHWADRAEARIMLAAAQAATKAAEADYQGWSRAYLATSHGGHVHRSMDCSTCNNGEYATSFFWVTALSGSTDDEIVDAAGERACTVCYEDAPVEKLAQATRVFSDDERDAQARAAERDAKRAAAVDAAVRDEAGRVMFKTVRGATNAVAQALTDLCWYGEDHPSAGEWEQEIEAIRAALAAKGVEFDYDAALARARKKVVADIRKAAKTEPTGYPGYVPTDVSQWPKY